ncbi:MAG: site-specific DNA-methyltransferase [Candidatus Celaenobacter antarcticus]|nr:site-specific DNA-methyltransferase [Candidatus Celaenobacter antarcticus]
MNGKSLDTKEDLIKKLRSIAPQVFNEDKIDWEKLKSTFGDEINFSDERYVLNWAGKSDAFRAIQTQTTATLIPDKDESVNFGETGNIFIEGENLEVLKVLQKAYYGKIKIIYIDPPYNTGNDFIYNDKFAEKKNEYLLRSGEKDEEGLLTNENLYRKNSKESGHYHSNWLTMMYPRLFLARNLLRDDGVIFISIDDNEVHNLRMIMNEIFGEENFVGILVWEKKRKGSFLAGSLTNIKEYILVYSKNDSVFNGLIGEIKNDKETYPCINPSNKREKRIIKSGIISNYKEKNFVLTKGSKITSGSMDMILHSDLIIKNGKVKQDFIIEGNWRYNQKSIDEYISKNELYLTEELYLRRIVTETRYKTLKDILPRIGTSGEVDNFHINNLFFDGWGTNEDGNIEITELLGHKGIYDYSKPSKLIKKFIASVRDENCIILDFFSGSSTTAHAVLDLNKKVSGNRKFIMVQLHEKTDEKSEAHKAGFDTIAEIGKERIRRVIKKIEHEQKEKLNFEENKQDLGFKVFKLQESNFKIWRGDKFKTNEELEKQLHAFVNPVKEESTEENMLYELLLKSGIDMNCKIEKIPLSFVAPERRKDGRGVNSDLSGDGVCYYLINENELVIALSKINEEIVKAIINTKPQKVITLDKLFEGSDQLKTNTTLQMKDAGIEFKVV